MTIKVTVNSFDDCCFNNLVKYCTPNVVVSVGLFFFNDCIKILLRSQRIPDLRGIASNDQKSTQKQTFGARYSVLQTQYFSGTTAKPKSN